MIIDFASRNVTETDRSKDWALAQEKVKDGVVVGYTSEGGLALIPIGELEVRDLAYLILHAQQVAVAQDD